nr:hypothetical protein [Rhodopirellula sp. SM50]
MNTWEDVKRKKAEMRTAAVSTLTENEKSILMKVLELEWENRHLKTPDIRRPLRTYIAQEIQ